MDTILDLLKTCNWQTIVGMFAIAWYFTHDIRTEIKSIHQDMKEQGQRIDRLYDMFVRLLMEKK